MADPVTNLENDIAIVAVIVLIGGACFGAGYMTRALTQKAKAAEVQVTAITKAADVSNSAETGIIKTMDKADQAVKEAHHAIAAAPKPAPSPSCDYGPVIAAWRSGIDRVRAAAAAAGDDSASGADSMSGAESSNGQDTGGPG